MTRIILLPFLLFLLFGIGVAKAQTGIGTLTPHASAQLDVVSASKGFLAPRMTTVQRTGISSPANGLLVYDTNTLSFWYFKTGTGWTNVSASTFTLPYSGSINTADSVFTINNQGSGTTILAKNGSANNGVTAIQGVLTHTAPGNIAAAIKGEVTGRSAIGSNSIGVYGHHRQNGIAVGGYSVGGTGVYASSDSSYGLAALSTYGTSLLANSSRSVTAEFTNNALNDSTLIKATTSGNGDAMRIVTNGTGKGLYSKTSLGYAIHAVSTVLSSTTIVGANEGGGLAILGSTKSNGQAGVMGYNTGGAYGVYGLVDSNKSGTASAVYGWIGRYGSTGAAGRFVNSNDSNRNRNTLEVSTTGLGNATDSSKGNASSFVVNNANSKAAAIYASTNTSVWPFNEEIATIRARATGMGGSAVGLFEATNPSGISSGIIASASGLGYGVEARARQGIGLLATSDTKGIHGESTTGTGIYAFTSGSGLAFEANVSSATGKVAVFKSANFSNTNPVILVEAYTYSGSLAADLAVFKARNSFSSSVNVARINNAGKGFFNGGTQNSGADIAEAFDVVNEISTYEPGDVLVIAKDRDRTVEKSDEAYSSLVIGVYATKPGVLLTEEGIDSDISDKVPMGVVGVIPTKVCLEGGAIKRGDMLVTSSQQGVAMKADPDKAKTGQIIGKALQNYDAPGVGKINVFVNVK